MISFILSKGNNVSTITCTTNRHVKLSITDENMFIILGIYAKWTKIGALMVGITYAKIGKQGICQTRVSDSFIFKVSMKPNARIGWSQIA